MRIPALLSLTVVLANADTLTLKDGRIMNGTFLGGTAREIRLDMGDHVENIAVERVSTLLFDNSGPTAQADPPPPPRERRPIAANPNIDRDNPPPPPPNYRNDPPPAQALAGLIIPTGTPLTVRMID